jgi:hypothetical protein
MMNTPQLARFLHLETMWKAGLLRRFWVVPLTEHHRSILNYER